MKNIHSGDKHSEKLCEKLTLMIPSPASLVFSEYKGSLPNLNTCNVHFSCRLTQLVCSEVMLSLSPADFVLVTTDFGNTQKV